MKKYSLGVFLNIFKRDRVDWQRQIEFIRSLRKVEHVEIMLEETEIDTKDILFLSDNLKNYKIILHAPFMDVALLSLHEEIVQASFKILKKSIQIGSILDAKLITIHLERYPNAWSERDVVGKSMLWIDRLTKMSPFPFAVENLSFSGLTQIAYPSTKNGIINLMKKLPNSSGLTIDIGHLLKDGTDVFDVLKNTHKSVLNMHLHDGMKGSAHLRLGDGNLDLDRFFSFLKESKYDKFVTLEVIGEKEIRDSWKLAVDYSSRYL